MQVNISNNINLSNLNVKNMANANTEGYTKTKSEDKFGSVLQKEKKNLSLNGDNFERKVDKKELDENPIIGSNKKVSNLKDTSSVQQNKVEDKESVEELSKDDIINSLAEIVELINKAALVKANAQEQNIDVEDSTLNSQIDNLLLGLETGKDNELLNQKNLNIIEGLLNDLGVKIDGELESKDESLTLLAEIVGLINEMVLGGINTEDQNARLGESTLDSETLSQQISKLGVKIDEEVESKEDILSYLSGIVELMNEMSDKLIVAEDLNSGTQSSMNQKDAVNVISNLLSVLETGESNELLNKESLTTIEGLINKLGVKLDEEVGIKEIKTYDVLRELVKEVSSDVKNLVEMKTSKEILQNSILAKGLTLKEEVPKSNNVDVTSNKVVNEVNYVKETLAGTTFSDSGKESNQNNSRTLNEEISKETKLLSSILDDGDEKENNKFSVIVDRLGTQTTTKITPEPTVINKESIATDVIKNVKLMVTNNIKELTVKINPGQLGEITIKIIEEGGVMKANLKASSRETYNLLSQQLGDIKKTLGEQNIKIQEVNVSIYEEDATFYKDGQFSSNSFQNDANNRQNKGTEFTGEFTEDELKDNNELNEEGNINMLA